MTVHAFVDESARPPLYLISAAIVEPSQVRHLRRAMRGLLRPGQRELHFYKEKRGQPATRGHRRPPAGGGERLHPLLGPGP